MKTSLRASSSSLFGMTVTSWNYKNAIEKLNSLQSNADVIASLRLKRGELNHKSLPEMRHYLNRIGYQENDLNLLNAIHVAGTKGKGSTSAMCESIIRHSQFTNSRLEIVTPKTGFYSSPHLIEVRERLRINGTPISQETFSNYFHEIWDKLESTKNTRTEFPSFPNYFRFLTLLAFHVFLKEKVTCAIIEVGIGGEYDATNILPQPFVTVITSLGHDHQVLLGKTISEIAWHKAGIFKENAPAISALQDSAAENILKERAAEKGVPVKLAFVDKPFKYNINRVGLQGRHQIINAAVAIDTCRMWMKQFTEKHRLTLDGVDEGLLDLGETLIPDVFQLGLADVRFPGRAQVVTSLKYPAVEFYFDGAHTSESLEVCREWFKSCITGEEGECRILMFNCTNGREPLSLLFPLAQLHQKFPFQHVLFCTNNLERSHPDSLNNNMDSNSNLETQRILLKSWVQLIGPKNENNSKNYLSISKALEEVKSLSLSGGKQCKVLVTGSLHLVGGVMYTIGAHPGS